MTDKTADISNAELATMLRGMIRRLDELEDRIETLSESINAVETDKEVPMINLRNRQTTITEFHPNPRPKSKDDFPLL